MKNRITWPFGLIVILAFTHCGSSQVFESDPGFTLDSCYVEPWTAGDQDQYRGVNLFFPVTSGRTVILDTVYFAGKKAPLQRIERDSYLVYKAVVDTTYAPYDVIAHADPREEFGNRPPEVHKSPFELKPGEAVISFMDKGRRKYFKVTGMTLSAAVRYEKRPRLKN